MLWGSLGASLANAKSYGQNPVAFYRELSGSGDSYRPVVPFDLFGPNVLVNDPDLVGTVLASPSGRSFGKSGQRFFTVISRMLGSGLFTIDGPGHQHRRRVVQPVLRPGSLRSAAAAMTRSAERLRGRTRGPAQPAGGTGVGVRPLFTIPEHGLVMGLAARSG